MVEFAHQRALVLAPHGRDALVAGALLGEAKIPATVCNGIMDLCDCLCEGTLFAVVTEEALLQNSIDGIAHFVANQPAWSSLPFIILTRHGGEPQRNPDVARLSDSLRNVTFLERPFHGATFLSVARSAMRGRVRQYEAQTREDNLRASEEALRDLNETLEQRVAERTRELEEAHALILAEISHREKAEKDLRQAQKMEMLGKFTGGVAHDFNNLLMAVMSNLELLSKHVSTDAKTTRLIDGAVKGAQRGAALTQRLLAFARQQDLKVEPRDVSMIVRSSKQLLLHSVGEGVELEFHLADGLPRALVDENQLDLALLNLVVNARDAMPDGGTIKISVEHLAGRADSAGTQPGHIRLSVVDNGMGMDEKTLELATQPFFSTKELGKGTGLGLSMIHGLAVQLGGRLVLTSVLGQGTTADLWLPVSVMQESVPMPAEPDKSDAMDVTSLRILFVDDDILIAMSSVEMLQDLGHEVIEANSGFQAIDVLRSQQDLDLMITDFSMPKMNGGQLAVAAREIRPGLPILVATGYAELPPGTELDLPRLTKPYTQFQLQAEIETVLKEGQVSAALTENRR